MTRSTTYLLFAAGLLVQITGAWAQRRNNWNYGDDGDDDNDSYSDRFGGGDDDDDDDSFSNYGFSSQGSFDSANTILIAHAIVASAVFVLLMPIGALVLRVNLKSPWVLKLHALFQVLSYLLYIAGAGMGIWLTRQTPGGQLMNDAHPRLGLAILAIAFFQPFFGFIHHRIFKKRAASVKAGTTTKPPGRTAIGRVHLWVGRALIIMGIINGGLGIRLASNSPFRTDSETRTSGIVYGVIAGVMFLLYAVLVILFEIRRKRAQKTAPVLPAGGKEQGLPTYDESEQSSMASRQNTNANMQPNTQPRGNDASLPPSPVSAISRNDPPAVRYG